VDLVFVPGPHVECGFAELARYEMVTAEEGEAVWGAGVGFENREGCAGLDVPVIQHVLKDVQKFASKWSVLDVDDDPRNCRMHVQFKIERTKQLCLILY
jgi:hypothetical protein